MLCDKKLSTLTKDVVTGDFTSKADKARHDSEKIAKVIAEL
jgi:hypothetical protein